MTRVPSLLTEGRHIRGAARSLLTPVAGSRRKPWAQCASTYGVGLGTGADGSTVGVAVGSGVGVASVDGAGDSSVLITTGSLPTRLPSRYAPAQPAKTERPSNVIRTAPWGSPTRQA